MARFLSSQFEHGGRLYHLELTIDRIAALRDELSINIVARSYSERRDGAAEIEAALTLDLERNEIIVAIEGEEIGRIPLDATEVAEADEADVGAEGAAHGAWEPLVRHLVDRNGNPLAETVEAIIEAIPTGDPLLGCLLKGAISAGVGQIIRCHGKLQPQDETVGEKLRAIARCLGRSVWGMLGRATVRSLRCMARGGI
ncbi:hypothetical protein OK349_11960 [Sphingomonas sp. BT-65]|uniref:hypothetical protein n=1 Tax=Sphingomonas sp. BT-65 TaxID=2989821 RepID=UPI0022361ADD|nr:hypothetical protein [Sphingomonas sp. BT-65]MCW4462424.1 hypothetical protein [Sphingomonas sp. BT-65]